VKNAQAVVTHFNGDLGEFSKFLWSFSAGTPVQHRIKTLEEIPSKTAVSDLMSKELRRRGFTFVGSTICYAFMQATGMVNDHLLSCPRYGPCKTLGKTSRF